MRKKLFLALLAFFLIVGQALASNVYKAEIMDTDFDAVTTSDTSTTVNIQGYEKVAFFVTYDEAEVGNSITAAVTIDISFDGTTWLDASFYDYAGGATLQTSETLSSDGSYYMWFNKDICAPYVRVAIAATNTDADDLLNVKVYIVAKE